MSDNASDVIDTDEAKTERLSRAVNAILAQLHPLIDGKVVLALDGMVIVQHPDGKVGCSHFNTGIDDETKQWAREQAGFYHAGKFGEPDGRERNSHRIPRKH